MNDELSPDVVPALRRTLLDHYDRTRRELPWRGEVDPYRIWVSEVMLQQTRVDTVLPYYRRWIERFPDVTALADADEDDVMLAWTGLGYYRRARNLKLGAALVRERHGGSVPDSYAALRQLPGIGVYTAGAIASIAFDEVVPAVDGNVRRVLARVFDAATPTAAWLRRRAAALVDEERPGDWNQALMELGATVCLPRAPTCSECPWARWCRALRHGTQAQRPTAARTAPVRSEIFATAVVLDAEGRGLVERRPRDGLLGGMWSFPGEAVSDGEDIVVAARKAAWRAGAALEARQRAEHLTPVQHRFSHLAATYRPVLLRGDAEEASDRRWISLNPGGEVALPVAQQKIARAACAAWVGS